MEPDKLNYSTIWKEYGEEFKIVGASSRHTRRIVRNFMKRVDYSSMIDIGCGTGLLLKSLDLKNKRIAGVDISKSGIEMCKEKMPQGKFYILNIEKKHTREMYDLAICSEVLEHLKDDASALKNIRRMCNYLIISVPAGAYKSDDKDVGHYRRYSKKNLLKLLKEAGFKPILVKNWGFPFYSPLYRLIMRNTKEKQRAGKITIFKRISSDFFYFLFFLNVINKGDRLFVLAK